MSQRRTPKQEEAAAVTTITIGREALRWGSLVLSGIALIVMVVTLLVTPQNVFNTVSYSALGVAIAGLIAFVAIDPDALVTWVTGQRGQYALTSILLSVFVVAALLALYVVLRQSDVAPIDLAENSRYRLSEPTLELLGELEQDIEIVGFYPANALTQREEADLLLQNYERAAGGRLTYRFVDPDRNPALAQQYNVTGTSLIILSGEDQADAFFADENSITNGIVQVLAGEARKAYAITGHGERDFTGFTPDGYSEMAAALQRVNFAVEPLNLANTDAVPEDAELLLVAGPISQFLPQEVEAIDAYLSEGGALLLLADPAGSLAGSVLGVDFDDAGGRFVTSGFDGAIKVWDADTREEQLEISGHSAEVIDVAFSPDGTQIASMSFDGTVRIWDAETGEEIASLPANSRSGAGKLAFSPDGSLLASAAADALIYVWETDSYEPASYAPIAAPTQLYALAFSPDGGALVAGGGLPATVEAPSSGLLLGYDPASGEPLFEERLHSAPILDLAFETSVAVAAPAAEQAEADAATPAAAAAVVVTTAQDGTIGRYDLAEGEGSTTSPFEQPVTALAFAPDGAGAYALFGQPAQIALAAAGADPGDDDTVLDGPEQQIFSLAYSPDGETLVGTSLDGDIWLWDAASGEQLDIIEDAHAADDPLLAYLAESWGVTVNNDFVIQLNGFSADGLSLLITDFAAGSPITDSLEAQGARVALLVAHSVTLDQDFLSANGLLGVSLFNTPGQDGFTGQLLSWATTNDPTFTGVANFQEGVDTPGPINLAASVENSTTGGRVVVIGDADFASNQVLQQGAGVANSQLAVNAANWLTENEDSIDLPPADFTQRQLDRPFTPVGLTLVGLGSTCLVPGAILIGGIITWVTRRRRR